MKTHVYRIGEITGLGRTKTEAMVDAIKQADEALKGSFCPTLVKHPECDETLVVFRQVEGWAYWQVGSACTIGSYASREEADAAARRHLAQNVFGTVADEGFSLLKRPCDVADHARWVAWQKGVRAALAAGATIDEAREWDNPTRRAA